MSTKFKQGIEVTGQVTATSFSGDGSALTGVSGGGSTTWANITDINNASGPDTIAIGTSSSAGTEAVAIGKGTAGVGDYAQAIGNNAGNSGQGVAAVAIGSEAGETNQGTKAVAVGQRAGETTQGANAVAIGVDAGKTSQGNFAVAIGINAGETSQSSGAVAIGSNVGLTGQGESAVAIGNNTGNANQGIKAVAVGYLAGNSGQGDSAIAIGHDAGQSNQAANSIVISATGVETNNTTANSLVIKPIRNASGTHGMEYNPTTGEVTYDTLAAGGGSANVVDDTTPQLGGTLDANGNTIDMGTNVLTDTNLGQFITAYGWGDHGSAGYQTAGGLNAAIAGHLNQSNPTSGFVLSWNGSDYAWTANGTGSGLSDVVDDTTPELGGDLATNSNKITFGAAAELQMYNTGTKSIISSATDDMYFQRTSDSVPAYFFEAINDGFAGPYISLKHDTVSPSTIDFATIAHDGKNDAAEDIVYSSIQFTTRSITDGTESGKTIFKAMRFGTNKTLLTINPQYADVEIGDNGAVRISRGSTPLRPTGETGMIRYNTTTSSFEGYGDSAWGDITNLEHTFTMTANGSSDYVFAQDSKFFTSNTNDPILYLRRGETYNFVNNSGGSHPFEIRASNGGSAYSTGVTNNGASSGNIVFTVPMGAPATLYYQCTSHASMGNVINIV